MSAVLAFLLFSFAAAGESSVTFYGGAERVGGSCAIVESGGSCVMVDCGSPYGEEVGRSAKGNVSGFGFDPQGVGDVLITHAHQDHAGRIPSLVRAGFSGSVWMTPPTKALLAATWRKQVMYDPEDFTWEWSERSHKRGFTTVHWRTDCEYARKIAKGRRRSFRGSYAVLQTAVLTNAMTSCLSLCSTCQGRELESVMSHVRTVSFGEKLKLGPFEIVFRPGKHLPGSASIAFTDGQSSWVFSGDLGTVCSRLVDHVEPAEKADAVFVESTYGDESAVGDADGECLRFQERVGKVVKDDGLAWIPAFALDRSLRVLIEIQRGMAAGIIDAETPVYYLSASSRQLAHTYVGHPEWFDNASAADVRDLLARCRTKFDAKGYAGGKGILLTTSGMMDAGCSRAFLPYLASRKDVTVCLAGYQAPGTFGFRLKNGAKTLTVARDGTSSKFKVACRTEAFRCFSGHADAREVEQWLSNNWSSKIYLVHGDPSALKQRKAGLESRFNADVQIAKPGRRYVIRRSPPLSDGGIRDKMMSIGR